MRSKKKIYQFKSILDGHDAVSYLRELIQNALSPKDFVELATEHELPAFIEVEESDYTAEEQDTGRHFHPAGLYEVVQELKAHMRGHTVDPYGPSGGRYCINLTNMECLPCLIYKGPNDKGKTVEIDITGEIDGEFAKDEDNPELYCEYSEPLLFKPADIQALADKLNGKPPAEAQQEELAALRKQVNELEAENEKLKAHGAVAGGVTFPYSTPELEVMQRAAIHYWKDYTDERRKPTQTEIALTIMEKLGASPTAEGRPPRKASQYATAIQPEKYRERDTVA